MIEVGVGNVLDLTIFWILLGPRIWGRLVFWLRYIPNWRARRYDQYP